jgi:uncharacterized protein (DUF2141 family)
MRRLLVFGLMMAFLTACGSSKPAFTDNGNPGQIKAIVFYDDNRNGKMDSNEAGAPVEAGISQDVSCPASSLDKVTRKNADAKGVVIFDALKPGKYCVGLSGNYSMTTKATQDVYVSSDMVTTVMFGIIKDQ